MSPICPTLLLLLAMLPSALLAQTSYRMVTTVQEALETRLAAETASIETRQAAQTASLETRLAAQTASLEDRLEDRLDAKTASLETRLAAQTAALHEKIASLEGALTAATQDIGALVTAFQKASTQMAKCCESPATTATLTQTPATTPTSTVKPSTTPGTTETPTTTPTTTKISSTTPSTTETPTTTPAATPSPITTPTTTMRPTTTPTECFTLAPTGTPRSIVFLRRQDGSVDFYEDWAAYKCGFGNQGAEFWLGLDNLHNLTTRHNYGLRADLTDWSGETKWAVYSTFRVAGEADGYRLTLSGFNRASTAGNSMNHNSGSRFSTRDRDNDRAGGSCADYLQGAWWYWACTRANPTGLYKPAGYRGDQGIYWVHAYGDYRSFKHITLTLIST